MNAELITIGDELLIGQVVNTNASFIGEILHENGIKLLRMTTVGDNEIQMLHVFTRAWKENDVVITTGGLGPTHDDLTRKVVTNFFKTKLVVNEDVLRDVRLFFEKRKRQINAINDEQSLVPESAKIILNANGTAPGYMFEKEKKVFFVLPGVPYEMKAMMESTVVPYLKHLRKSVTKSQTLVTTGIFESTLSLALGNINDWIGEHSLAFLPSSSGVRMRVTVSAEDEHAADKILNHITEKIYSLVGDYIYGKDKEELEEVLARILIEHKLTLAVAESCTGGLIGHKITNIPGSSEYFVRDIVAYSNETKVEVLQVPKGLIETYGAVSSEVARSMAENVRMISNTSIGISTTGIAGPKGGTEMKPVGLVWIGYSDENETSSYKFLFGDHRIRTKERAAQTALEIIRRKLLGLPIKLY